jgi:ribA/ribD-fused uncharacterized protein
MSEDLVLKNSFYDDDNIKGLFNEYGYLSNFHLCDIEFERDTYPSSENAFQAAKAMWADRDPFFTCTPQASKKLGKDLNINVDEWNNRKLDVMYRVLMCKFSQNEDLKEKLLNTGDKYLEETNWWNDTFWGVCNGHGENQLGKVLMEVRSELRGEY